MGLLLVAIAITDRPTEKYVTDFPVGDPARFEGAEGPLGQEAQQVLDEESVQEASSSSLCNQLADDRRVCRFHLRISASLGDQHFDLVENFGGPGKEFVRGVEVVFDLSWKTGASQAQCPHQERSCRVPQLQVVQGLTGTGAPVSVAHGEVECVHQFRFVFH